MKTKINQIEIKGSALSVVDETDLEHQSFHYKRIEKGNMMNRAQRRAMKSNKGGKYRGLKRPTDDGVANGGKKRYG